MEPLLQNCLRIFYISILVCLITACGSLDERVQTYHPNGLKKLVHVYSGDDWVKLKTFHMNNIRATEVEIQGGQPHGSYTRWNTKGTLVERGEYQYGKKSGLWTQYLSRTEKISEGQYHQGKKVGTWKGYWPQGTVQSESHWDQGIPTDTTREWYYDGTLRMKHNCFNQGQYFEYYFNGKLKEKYDCQEDMTKTGIWEKYDLLGHRIFQAHFNSQGIPHGSWLWTKALGDTLQLRQYQEGLLHGLQQVGSQTFNFVQGSGSIQHPCPDSTGLTNQICADTTWVAGQVSGTSMHWEPGEFLKKETWDQGKKIWQEKFRVDSLGVKKPVSSGGFKNNLRHGPWIVWHANGQISQKLNYEKDYYMGQQWHHDTLGQVTMVKTYKGKNHKVLVEIIDSTWRSQHLPND